MVEDYIIEIDFYSDWVNILKKELEKLGYTVPVDEEPEKICHKYFNLQKKIIDPRPRKVLISKEFTCPSEHQNGLEQLKAKIEKGDNLRPHLSTNLMELEEDDDLLNDWGIYHLHLGAKLDKRGFIKRTGPLLFARFDDKYSYFINVMPHASWTKQIMLKVIHENWPDSITKYRLKGLSLEKKYTDNEITELRNAHVQTIIEVEHGIIYAPIGGGYMTTGISTEVVMLSNNHLKYIGNLENKVKNNISKFIDLAKNKGLDIDKKLKFKLILKNGKPYTIELNSGIEFNL